MDNKNAITDFKNMIKQSWTYGKMTISERNAWDSLLEHTRTTDALKGTYKQRFDILNAVYYSYLIGIGYSDFSWRENEKDAQ